MLHFGIVTLSHNVLTLGRKVIAYHEFRSRPLGNCYCLYRYCSRGTVNVIASYSYWFKLHKQTVSLLEKKWPFTSGVI